MALTMNSPRGVEVSTSTSRRMSAYPRRLPFLALGLILLVGAYAYARLTRKLEAAPA